MWKEGAIQSDLSIVGARHLDCRCKCYVKEVSVKTINQKIIALKFPARCLFFILNYQVFV